MHKRSSISIRLLLIFFFFLLIYFPSAHAGEFTAGSWTFLRTTGAPDVQTVNFDIKNTDTSYTIHVYNGGYDSKYGTVSSAVVSLNNQMVFGTNSFNKTVTHLQAPVSVLYSNTLSIDLRSAPATALVVKLIGTDNGPPAVNITSPEDGSYFNAGMITVSGNATDFTTSVTSVTVNDINTVFNGETFTVNIQLMEGMNTVTAKAVDSGGNIGTGSIVVFLDTTPPALSINSPQDNALFNTPVITVSGAASDPGGIGVVSINNVGATLSEGLYTADVQLSEGPNPFTVTAKDMAENQTSKTITVNLDTIPPSPASTVPGQNETNVPVALPITIEFSEPVNTSTVTEQTVSINNTESTISLGGSRVTIIPSTPFNYNATYNVTTKGGANGIKDIAGNAMAGDYVFSFTTEPPPVSPPVINITEPQDSAVINKEKAIIKGTIESTAPEVGVKVNGIIANINGDLWSAIVPLVIGQNVITVEAVDNYENKSVSAITINTENISQPIDINTIPGSGISPLEVSFIINTATSNTITNYRIDYDGNGTIDEESPDGTGMKYTYTIPGLYFPNVTVIDEQGNTYSETAIVNVLSKEEMDILLKGKWEGMKGALAAGNIEGAVKYFTVESGQLYIDIFTVLSQKMSQIIMDMQDIELISLKENAAKYRIRKNETYGGQAVAISYFVYFVLGEDGLWKIERF